MTADAVLGFMLEAVGSIERLPLNYVLLQAPSATGFPAHNIR